MPRFFSGVFSRSKSATQPTPVASVVTAVTATPEEVTAVTATPEEVTAVTATPEEVTAVTATPEEVPTASEIAAAQAAASAVTAGSEAPTPAPTILSRVAGGAEFAVQVGAVHGAAFAGYAPAYLGKEVFVLGREGVQGNIQPTTMHRVGAAVADVGVGGAIAGLIAGASTLLSAPVSVPLLTAAFTIGGALHLYGVGDAAVSAAERAFTRQGQAAENHEAAAEEAPDLAAAYAAAEAPVAPLAAPELAPHDDAPVAPGLTGLLEPHLPDLI